uniref:Uncharacterized protein n=1 Tax=Arundo donax TaxID=35708 RepID=A0A0A9BQF1_ARUDO
MQRPLMDQQLRGCLDDHSMNFMIWIEYPTKTGLESYEKAHCKS